MFDQMTLLDTRSATSSPASEGGATRCDSPAGPTMNRYGLAPALASHSVRQARDWGRKTRVTFGRNSVVSFASADLQKSLASRLLVAMDANGSPEYSLTWKRWAIAQQEPICARRASARRMQDNACSGWPTLNTPNGGRSIKHAERVGRTAYHNGKKVQMGLEAAASLVTVGWQTPTCPVNTNGHQAGNNRYVTSSRRSLAGWAMPRARDCKGNGVSIARAAKGVADSLDMQCKLVCRSGTDQQSPLDVRMDRAVPPLNPAHSRWLMGYPRAWDDCGVTAMQSLPRSRRNSSARTCTPGDRT